MKPLLIVVIVLGAAGCTQVTDDVVVPVTEPEPVIEVIETENPGSANELLSVIQTSELIPAGPVEISIYFDTGSHATGVINHNRDDLIEQIDWWAYNTEAGWELLLDTTDEKVACDQLLETEFPEMMLGNCL